jgi:hypothetical protein
MGGGNSPAIACRFGLAFIRKLQEKHPDLFGGSGRPNSWSEGLDGNSGEEKYDPKKGFGMIWEDLDGEAAALIWAFVDDFLLHAPTYEKLCRSLTAFMDLAVDCGFLCHPGKLEPPNQVVKYVGFIINTQDVPSISMPVSKRDKALAMTKHLLDMTVALSALALAVVVGTLESVVEATPDRRGRGYLQHLYGVLHGTTTPKRTVGPNEKPGEVLMDEGEFQKWTAAAESQHSWAANDTIEEMMAGQGVEGLTHQTKYFRDVKLTPEALQELEWWEALLVTGTACQTAYSEDGHVLTPTWGDGSGTGTGGTIETVSLRLTQWMGAWLPSSLPKSSNWKEMNTLLLTLRQILESPDLGSEVAGTTVFYFTDNVVTYYISHNGASRIKSLHQLIMKIKDLAHRLRIRLEVVHVPGLVMILQGTDGLSRGIWVGKDHDSQPSPRFTKAVFEPLKAHWLLPSWVQEQCRCEQTPVLRDWKGAWTKDLVLDQFGLWLPPPTIAQQLMYWLLGLWVERPLTTSFAVLVPRVMQREWQYLSRHVQQMGEFSAEDMPAGIEQLTLPIPMVLLMCNTHTRVLKPRRPKKAPVSAASKRHREQADEVRGL